MSLGPPGCDKRGGGGVAEVLRTAACGATAAVAGTAVAGAAAAVAGAAVTFTIGLFDAVFLFFFFSEDNVDSAISEVVLSFSFASFDDPCEFDSSLLSDFSFCFLSFEQHPQRPPFFLVSLGADDFFGLTFDNIGGFLLLFAAVSVAQLQSAN